MKNFNVMGGRFRKNQYTGALHEKRSVDHLQFLGGSWLGEKEEVGVFRRFDTPMRTM